MSQFPPGPYGTPTAPGYPAGPGAGPGYGAAVTSPDGAWMWNGAGWVPTGQVAPPGVYQPPRISALLATALLLLSGATGLFLAGATVHRYLFAGSVLDGSARGSIVDQGNAADNLVGAALGTMVLLALLTSIAFLTWVFVSVRNNPALGGRSLRFSPGAAVAWWFCPVANYVLPFLALRETWTVSARADGGRDGGAPGLLIAWWVAWLVTLGTFILTLVAGSRDQSLEQLRTHDIFLALFGVSWAVASFLGAALVRSLTARQAARAAALAPGGRAPG